MSLSATIVAKIGATETATLDLGNPNFSANLSSTISLTDGTGAGQADLIWTDTRTLAASASENLDLAGVLTDAISGAAITFAKIKAIMVKADSGNTNNVEVGGAASNALPLFKDATDIAVVRPGWTALLAGSTGGITVTAGTGDILKVANSGGTTGVTYSIVVIGTSV